MFKNYKIISLHGNLINLNIKLVEKIKWHNHPKEEKFPTLMKSTLN
jgi:hypothetical protein